MNFFCILSRDAHGNEWGRQAGPWSWGTWRQGKEMLLIRARAWILVLGFRGQRRRLTLNGYLLCAGCCAKSFHVLFHLFFTISIWHMHFHSCVIDGKLRLWKLSHFSRVRELLCDRQGWKAGLCDNTAHVPVTRSYSLKHCASVLSCVRAGGAWEEISCLHIN